jgi:hypothetical protein
MFTNHPEVDAWQWVVAEGGQKYIEAAGVPEDHFAAGTVYAEGCYYLYAMWRSGGRRFWFYDRFVLYDPPPDVEESPTRTAENLARALRRWDEGAETVLTGPKELSPEDRELLAQRLLTHISRSVEDSPTYTIRTRAYIRRNWPELVARFPDDAVDADFGKVQTCTNHPEIDPRQWLFVENREGFVADPSLPDGYFAAGIQGRSAGEYLFAMWVSGSRRFYFRSRYVEWIGKSQDSIQRTKYLLNQALQRWDEGLETVVFGPVRWLEPERGDGQNQAKWELLFRGGLPSVILCRSRDFF